MRKGVTGKGKVALDAMPVANVRRGAYLGGASIAASMGVSIRSGIIWHVGVLFVVKSGLQLHRKLRKLKHQGRKNENRRNVDIQQGMRTQKRWANRAFG